MRKTIEGLEKL